MKQKDQKKLNELDSSLLGGCGAVDGESALGAACAAVNAAFKKAEVALKPLEKKREDGSSAAGEALKNITANLPGMKQLGPEFHGNFLRWLVSGDEDIKSDALVAAAGIWGQSKVGAQKINKSSRKLDNKDNAAVKTVENNDIESIGAMLYAEGKWSIFKKKGGDTSADKIQEMDAIIMVAINRAAAWGLSLSKICMPHGNSPADCPSELSKEGRSCWDQRPSYKSLFRDRATRLIRQQDPRWLKVKERIMACLKGESTAEIGNKTHFIRLEQAKSQGCTIDKENTVCPDIENSYSSRKKTFEKLSLKVEEIKQKIKSSKSKSDKIQLQSELKDYVVDNKFIEHKNFIEKIESGRANVCTDDSKCVPIWSIHTSEKVKTIDGKETTGQSREDPVSIGRYLFCGPTSDISIDPNSIKKVTAAALSQTSQNVIPVETKNNLDLSLSYVSPLDKTYEQFMNIPISGFGEERGRGRHKGVDYFVPNGTPVYAIADGVVDSYGFMKPSRYEEITKWLLGKIKEQFNFDLELINGDIRRIDGNSSRKLYAAVAKSKNTSIKNAYYSLRDLLSRKDSPYKPVKGDSWITGICFRLNHTKVEDPEGLSYTRYLHLQDVYVMPGQNVKKGQLIGTVGRTGVFESADHLHLEIYDKKGSHGRDWLARKEIVGFSKLDIV